MDWRKIYPTMEAVQAANLDTVATWLEHLPAAQTDVERTVRRRLQARLDREGMAALRKERPDIAAKLEELTAMVERAIGRKIAP